MNSVFTSVVATPIWLTAITIAKAQTATRAIVASRSGLEKPACAVAPRTRPASALATSPAITSTTSATTRFGSHSSSCRSTSDTAGSPSASKATTSAIRRTNHLTISASRPAASVVTPMFWTKPLKPERCASSLKRTARRSAATAPASAPAMSQPMTRMIRKPMTRGMALRNKANAFASEVMIASPQSFTTVIALALHASQRHAPSHAVHRELTASGREARHRAGGAPAAAVSEDAGRSIVVNARSVPPLFRHGAGEADVNVVPGRGQAGRASLGCGAFVAESAGDGGPAEGAQQVEQGVAQRRRRLWGGPGALPAGVFAPTHVARVADAVLPSPVPSVERRGANDVSETRC